MPAVQRTGRQCAAGVRPSEPGNGRPKAREAPCSAAVTVTLPSEVAPDSAVFNSPVHYSAPHAEYCILRQTEEHRCRGRPVLAHVRPAGPMMLGLGVSAETHGHAMPTSTCIGLSYQTDNLDVGCASSFGQNTFASTGPAKEMAQRNTLRLISTSGRGLADPHPRSPNHRQKHIRNSQLPIRVVATLLLAMRVADLSMPWACFTPSNNRRGR